MPVIIIVVAVLILIWSIWSNRQAKLNVARNLETMVMNVCQGKPPPAAIRWANPMVKDAFMSSLDTLCEAASESISVGVFELETENMLEARVGNAGVIMMTLQIEYVSSSAIIVKGWSSE
ncbi:MAG: hypothetical protein CMJ39_06525 [Phycisphaerae bacterium]|nr:hypothetical protein [Phycisphaerae bacterium]|tara:strand:+ start:1134 stop:1493 length:360 start_codon:yes stop_codon:yes gene_type:complete